MEPANARATCMRWLVLIPLILFAYVSLSTICVHCVIYRYLIMINTSAKGIFYALENHWFFVWFFSDNPSSVHCDHLNKEPPVNHYCQISFFTMHSSLHNSSAHARLPLCFHRACKARQYRQGNGRCERYERDQRTAQLAELRRTCDRETGGRVRPSLQEHDLPAH